MTHKTLSLVASGCRDDDEFDSLIPGHIPEAEAAGSDLVVHGSFQP